MFVQNRQSEYAANPLDSTNVHPEAYSAAHALIKLSGAHLESLGAPKFIANIHAFADKAGNLCNNSISTWCIQNILNYSLQVM
jgi:transcriptional accessory protein Tex/SPT6